MKYTRPPFGREGVRTTRSMTIFATEPTEAPIPDTPVTPLENFRLAAEHKTPYWFPNATTDFDALIATALAGDAMIKTPWGAPTRHSYVDEWGSRWEYVPEVGGAMLDPKAPPVMEDVTEWKRRVVFPDLDKMDFATAAEDFMRNHYRADKVLHINLGQGATERLVAAMGGYAEAMTAMAEEPEACADFFAAITDWHARLLDKLLVYYPVTLITYHDDWGTERDTFFSEEMLKTQVLDCTRRLVEHVHGRGVYFELHSCGNIGRFFKHMIDMKIDLLQIQTRANDMPGMKREFGDKIGFNAFPRFLSAAEAGGIEPYLAALRETVDVFGRRGGAYVSTSTATPEETWDAVFELYGYSREFYENERDGG